MEVVVPVQDFHFDSTTSTPFVSAPSSPKAFGDPFEYYYHYTSAPNSPSRAAAIHNHFAAAGNLAGNSLSIDPSLDGEDDDFAFDFSGHIDNGLPAPALTAADELFEEGRIRPLKLPPRLHCPIPDESLATSHRGSRSPRHRVSISKDLDPFTAAMVEVTRERGRERLSASTSRKGSRSVSPLRRGGGGIEIRAFNLNPKSPDAFSPASSPATSSPAIKTGGSKKWRLRDLLLFRSASEGRVTGNRSKDPLRKYSLFPSSSSSSPVVNMKSANKKGEDSRSSSFRSTDSCDSTRKGSRPAVSAHEAHYMANRAASEELKKKTPLAYRQGLLGCLRFNPAVNIARGFNGYSLNRQRS